MQIESESNAGSQMTGWIAFSHIPQAAINKPEEPMPFRATLARSTVL
ncbi:MAG: hypothetical protein LBC63_03670 [Holophagales bacterium]|jgi:hypothetical protein|nr:hypothetical protein [Holophagales bacterium]